MAQFSLPSSVVQPRVTFSQMTGSIPNDSSYQITVYAYAVPNLLPNITWHLLPTAFASFTPNFSYSAGGAHVRLGTAKNIYITVKAPPQNSVETTVLPIVQPKPTPASSGHSFVYVEVAVIIVAILLLGTLAYALSRRRQKAAEGRKRKSKK